MFNGRLRSLLRFGFLESFGWWGFGHLLVDVLLGGLGLDAEEVVDGAGVVPVAEGAKEVPVVGVVIAGWWEGCLCFDLLLFFIRWCWFFFLLFLALLFDFFDDPIFTISHILLFSIISTPNPVYYFHWRQNRFAYKYWSIFLLLADSINTNILLF